MWNLNEYMSVEVSEIKTFANSTTYRRRSSFAKETKRQETYVTVTIFDKSQSLRGSVKSFNIRNPFPAFIKKIQEDLSLWTVIHSEIVVRASNDGEVADRKITLTSVLLQMPGGVVEVTNPIEVQIKNLSQSMDLLAWSQDSGKTWFVLGESEQ